LNVCPYLATDFLHRRPRGSWFYGGDNYCDAGGNGRNRWKVRFDTGLAPDITVAVRLNHSNEAPLDYYLLPRLDFGLPRISLADHNAIEIESYRFDTLDYFYGMAQRTRIRRAA